MNSFIIFVVIAQLEQWPSIAEYSHHYIMYVIRFFPLFVVSKNFVRVTSSWELEPSYAFKILLRVASAKFSKESCGLVSRDIIGRGGWNCAFIIIIGNVYSAKRSFSLSMRSWAVDWGAKKKVKRGDY